MKKLNLMVTTWRGCGGFETHRFNNFYFEKTVVVLEELILTVSTLGMCGSLERTDFNTFCFGRVWWS